MNFNSHKSHASSLTMNHTTLYAYLTYSSKDEFGSLDFMNITIQENSIETHCHDLSYQLADYLFSHPEGVYLSLNGVDQWTPSDGRSQTKGVVISMKPYDHPYLYSWFTYDVVDSRWGDVLLSNNDVIERGVSDSWIDQSWQRLMHTSMDQWDRLLAEQCRNTAQFSIQHDRPINDKILLMIEDRIMRLKRPLHMWNEVYTEVVLMMESPSLVRSDAYIIEMDHGIDQNFVWPTGTQVFRPLSSVV